MKKKQTRREFGATAFATVTASVLPAPFVLAAEKKYDPGATDTEIKLADRAALRPRFALWRVGPGRRSLFPDAERKGRHQRPQGQVPHHGRCLQRAEMRRGDAAAGRAGGSAGAVRFARHRAADRRPQIPQLQGRAAAAAQHRRLEMDDPKNNKWTMAGLPLYPTERGLRQACRCPNPNAKVGSLPERRFRPRLPRAVQEGAGRCRRHRQGDHGADLRPDRTDDRLAADQSVEVGRRRVLQHLDRQGVVAVDPQGGELGWKPLHLLSAARPGVRS